MLSTYLRAPGLWMLLFFASLAFQVDAKVDEKVFKEGKSLFTANCAACHNKDMKSKMTGPALGGVTERWAGRDKVLYAWIRNSQAVIASGDAYANKLYNEYNKSIMTAFPNLTDDQIKAMLVYIEGVAKGEDPTKAAAPTGGSKTGDAGSDGGSSIWLYITLAGILLLLTLVLTKIISNLKHMDRVKGGDLNSRPQTITQILTSKGAVSLLIFALIVLGGYTTVTNAVKLGRQQGYGPEQPIKFSHATHTGLQKIDCQYCHDGARRSKHSIIPAANTCMNCHKAIKVGSKYGTAELTKIYASIGYNPETDKYIENYDDMAQDKVEEIYKGWIKTNYMLKYELKTLDAAGERIVAEEWDNVVASLTNENKKKVQGPIEWVRIHNLPDHAYFNHAQHVSVGKVACQKCHGPVEKMEVVAQWSPLSMGWCINCHRKTEVQFTTNDYYKTFAKYQEQLETGKKEKVVVEDIGGLECQKCHY